MIEVVTIEMQVGVNLIGQPIYHRFSVEVERPKKFRKK